MVGGYIGTMGFSYKDWNGVFYPAELKASGYLRYYSRIFNCVEVDSTFYGTPRPLAVRCWAVNCQAIYVLPLKFAASRGTLRGLWKTFSK